MEKVKLLDLLDDEDIQKKIIDILTSTNIEVNSQTIELENKIDMEEYLLLKSKNENLENENKLLDEKLTVLKAEYENLREKHDTLLCEHQIYIDAEMEKKKWMDLCHNLSSDVYEGISNIVNVDDGYEGLMYSLVQLENLELMWDYIKEGIINNNVEAMKMPKELFLHGFEAYSKIDNRFELQEDLSGNKYDTESMIPHNNGKSYGDVISVLLPGYGLKKSGKIRKKAVVVLA